MSLKRFTVFALLAVSFGVAPARSQEDSLIEQEVDNVARDSRWQLGPLHLTPSLALGAGYDSNALSSPERELGDFRANVGPGIVAAVPFGGRGFFEVRQRLDFVYYHRVENLRNINNNTLLGGAFGGKNVVVRVTNHYRNDTSRPTTEFDIPVRQRTNQFGADASIALGWRHQLSAGFGNSIVRIRETVTPTDETAVQQRLNRNESRYSLTLSREMTEKTNTLFRGFYQQIDYEDKSVQRDGWAYGIEGGLSFAPQENVEGQVVLGYKRMDPEFEEQPSFRGLTAAVDASFRVMDRFQIGSIYGRDVSPSVIENNWFFVENRYGARFSVSVTETFAVTAGATFGRNTYPNPVALVDEDGRASEELIADRFAEYSLSFRFKATDGLSFRVTGRYQDRQSEIRLFQRDRFLLDLVIDQEFL